MTLSFNVADQVLNHFRDQFIAEMDANSVIMELLHKGIIPHSVQVTISQTNSPEQQNAFLHAQLQRTCTDDALKVACRVISAVKGNPKMIALGNDMLSQLELGMCTYVCSILYDFVLMYTSPLHEV